jgi:hypothetical protein
MTVEKTIIPLLILTLLSGIDSKAQLTIDAELRPRLEYRHGYKNLFPDNVDPASFVSQRTRLNANFILSKLDFYLSFQDVRVWGDVPQLNISDKNGLSIHQAWGKIHFTSEISVKLGRQEIAYDDHRIIGNVGWAQQARSHDAAQFSFYKNGYKADLSFAFNQNEESLTGHDLNVNTYKSLFLAWLHKDWSEFGASFLILNNGLQYLDEDDPDKNETRYSQTAGTHLTFNKTKLNIMANMYYQFGDDAAKNELSAYLLGLEASYKVSNTFSATLGGELQSGNDNGTPANGKNTAFTPLYGTNHKFNGFMDYFYVGNHINSAGLFDVFARTKITVSERSVFDLALHNFSVTADISGSETRQLGTEIDFVYSYDFMEEVNIQAGYSHMFPSEGLELLKNNFDNNTNNWAWLMVTINPVLFKSTITKTN